MSALTYDVGDTAYVTFQLVDPATGLPADATTATSTVTDPDGVISTPVPQHVGAAGSGQYSLTFTVGKAGVWRGVGIFTGTAADRVPFALVATDTGVVLAWSPTLREVADYVPGRTRPVTPGAGDDQLLGTFGPNTRPTGEQVARQIAGATAHVAAVVGVVDVSLYPLAKTATAQRAAAFVEYSYPERNADINVGDSLLALSEKTLDRLATANLATSGVAVGAALLPYWSFPAPSAHGDLTLT